MSPCSCLAETVFPKFQAVFRYGISYACGHTRAYTAGAHAFPGKKGEDGTGGACFVAEIKMISARIVEIHCFFDEALSEDFGVEILIAPGITGDGCDMVEAEYSV